MIKKKEKGITNIELLESINRSFSKIEGKMATKEDIKNMATKEDIKNMATKEDIKNMATKEDIEGLKGQIQGVDKRIDDFVATRVKHDDHNKLKTRVDLIEQKLESKSK